MIAHVPVCVGSVVSEEDFYARFVELRLKLKALGAEIISVRHANHWVDVDWLPQGADRHAEPTRSTLYRLMAEQEIEGASDFMFAPGEESGALRLSS